MERLFGTLVVTPDILGTGKGIIRTHKMSPYLRRSACPTFISQSHIQYIAIYLCNVLCI